MSGRKEDDATYYARLLEAGIKAATVVTLALPAIGVLVRMVSFRIGGVPGEIAVATGLPELAYLGLQAVLWAGVWALLGLCYWAMLGPAYPFRDADRPIHRVVRWQVTRFRQIRLRHPIAYTLGLIGCVVAVAWLAPLGLFPLGVGLVLARSLTHWAARRDGRPFRAVTPALVASLVLLSAYFGVIPGEPAAIFIRPLDAVELPRAGWYNVLGRDDTWTYAWECSNAHVVAIRSSSIAGGTFESAGSSIAGYMDTVSLADVSSGRVRYGFRPNCPQPATSRAVAVTVAVNDPSEASR